MAEEIATVHEETDPPQSQSAPEIPQMEIHKPKPVHSWRELLTEIGVVVVGVCIALAAEQAVEWVHWRNQVIEARQAIASEMADNVRGSINRLREQVCVDRRLDELGQILDAASRSGSLPPVGMIGLPSLQPWVSGAWESVVASQAASHFSRQELAHLARSYNYVQLANGIHVSEAQVWGGLSAITGPGRRLDSASEAELRRDLSLARQYERNLAGLALQIILSLKPQNLPYNQSELDAIAAARDRPLTNSVICRPIGAVPLQYGQSAYSEPRNLLEIGMKLLPNTAAPAP